MADFAGNLRSEVKDSLNRKIDTQRDKFLKGISTSKHGKKEDPTYLHFKFIFDTGDTSPIDPETFLAPSPLFRPYNPPPPEKSKQELEKMTKKDFDEYNQERATSITGAGFITADEFFYGSKFKINGMQDVGAFPINGGFAYMSAQQFLYQRSVKRRDMLSAFRNGLLYINQNCPYYFQSITGLDQLLKADIKNIHKGPGKPQRMGTLNVECLESIDMRIFALSELYRKAVYDYTYHRTMLPENLRKFRMWLVVTEIRNIQLSYGINDVLNPFSIPAVANAANFADSFNSQTGFLDKIGGDSQKSTNTDPNNPNSDKFGSYEMGPYAFVYQFDQCEFDFDDSYPSYSTIDNKGSGPVTNKFKIHVGRVKDYKIQFNQLADVIKKNDNIKQMVISDVWGSAEGDYNNYEYVGATGISNVDLSDKPNPAQAFSQMASNFITNTVADLKNQGVSILQGALLGNIYGLGGMNLGASTRSAQSLINTLKNGIPNPLADNSPQAKGLGGPGERQYPTLNEDAYPNSSAQPSQNLGNALGNSSANPSNLKEDVYKNVPGKDLGLPDRQYQKVKTDEYKDVPGKDLGVPKRVYNKPKEDVYPTNPGVDGGLPDRQYPKLKIDEYSNVPGTDLGVPGRIYQPVNGDVYPTNPGVDLGLPTRIYGPASGDEYNNVPGKDLGIPERIYDQPSGDQYLNTPGKDLGGSAREYPPADGNEYPPAPDKGLPPNLARIYPEPENKYPQVRDTEYKESPKWIHENQDDVYKTVPGPDLGGRERKYPSINYDEYPPLTPRMQTNLGRTYPSSGNSENS